jgi:tetratricopeptide (TPR) repeat protein
MRGLYHARKERLTAAEHDLSVAVDAQPDNELHRAVLAWLRLQNGVELHWTAQQFAALDDEMRALEAHATTARSLLVVGMHHARRGRLAEARERLTRALDIEPTSAAICAALAWVALRLGDVDVGYDLTERALHVAPDGADTSELVVQLAQARKLRDLRRQRMSGETGAPR